MELMRKHKEFLLHAVMSFVGGFLGLFAICSHGRFASAQTGNMMYMVIDLQAGDFFDLAVRVGALFLFIGGIALSWLVKERSLLPVQPVSLLIDTLALLISARMPEEIYPFLALYPIFFASSFQWGSFGSVASCVSSTLFMTGNLRNCVVRWMKYIVYRKRPDFEAARMYTVTIASYIFGGCLGCAGVAWFGLPAAYLGLLPLAAAAVLLKI